MSDLTPAAGPGDDSLEGVERELLEGEGARLGSDDARVDRAAARLVVQCFRAGERRRRVLVTGGSALALAAAVALAVGLSRHGDEADRLAHAARAPQSSLVVESGSVRLPGAASVGRGAPVAANALAELAPGTCLRAGSRVRLCTSAGAKLKLPALGGAWDVELQAGVVTADLEAMPAGFSIRTLHGVAAVEGTLFSVELEASRAFTSVLVERGRVHVTNQRLGEQAVLLAGERARLGERLELSGRGQAPLALGAPSSAAPVDAASDSQSPAHRGVAAPAAPQLKTASELLDQARQERGSGHYAQAAQLYRKLVQQHPESAEARAALVSLGQLELGQLGQPEAALRSFQAYLARPGQLRQEAEHGVISALQRLGRKADERRAIEAFLARYPKSTQAGALSQRLKQL